ncbi:unnamed protein product [Trichobilharzia szidati]|nr:unnamed protein product [Trichobilharzia szidati]
MSGLKLEDPTVDVADIEKYRMAFLMQFFVQHKRRFRFPRLRLQDLYQKVLKDPDPVAFCDLAARILRFLNHDDPDICMATLDQALDRFAIDKRTSYRINIQRHRNGKLVHQLGSAARAALLDNLIESVYDEQPDFNFTTCFNSSLTNSGRVGGGGGIGTSNNGPGSTGFDRMVVDSSQDLYNSGVGGGAGGDIGCTDDPEDVNVLIKAGQDAQGCSYYYMDDLRLYRERPQSGISSQWDVVVGPTADQWLAFIMSLSRNEKEYDLHCFLKQDLFELVKESLDAMELHAPNTELDSNYLRTKELNELAELRRRQLGHNNHHKLTSLSSVENDKLQLNNNNNIVSLSASGPKSASPAFSGGHGCGGGISGIGSSGSSSSTSGAPLTPSSARTPTSAPPASSLQPQQQQQASLPPPDCQETQGTSMKLEDSSSNQPTVWPQDTMSAKMRTHSGQSPCEAADFIGTPKSEGSNTECSTATTTTPSVAFSNANQDVPASQNNSAGVATPTTTATTIPSLLHSLSSPASFSATTTPTPTTTGRHHSGVSGGGSNLLNNTTTGSSSESDQISSAQSQNCDPVVAESTTASTTTTVPMMNNTNNDMSNNFPVTPTPTTGVSVITGQLPPPSSPITTTTTPTPTSSSSSLPGVAVVSEPSSASWNSPGYNNCNSNMASSSPSLQQRECKLPPPPTSNDPVSISTQPSSYVRPNNTGGIDDTTTTPTVTVTQPNSNNYLSYSPTCHQSTQQQNQIPGNLTSKQQQQDTHITTTTASTTGVAAKLSSPAEGINPNLSKMSNSGQFRQMSIGSSQQDTSPCSGGGMDYPLPAPKQCLGAGGGGGGGPATALVSPMIGIPPSDAIAAGVIGGGGGVGMPPLTQEQWENRKSKIAQLEKIHSTLSKSKSASTPGAIAAATAGAVLQQQQQQQQQQRLMRNSMQQQQQPPPIGLGIPPSSAINNTSPYPDSLGGGTRPFDTENYNSMMSRQGVVVGSSMNSESAQQEWDRLCSDYQRGKTDTSGMMLRYPGASRQMGFFDSNDANLPSVPPQSMTATGSGTGTIMLPSGQMMMMDHQQQQQHQQTCQPPAYQSGGVGGGPPVVMVPPNNSNMCPVNSGYPPPSNALTSLPPPDPGRALGPMGTIGPEQQMPTGGAGGGGITPTAGQKRSYHHSVSSGENWPPLNSSNPLSMSPVVQGIENSNFLGHHIPPSNNSSAVCRSGQMMMMPTMMNAPVSSASASSPIGASVAPISQQPAVVGRGSGSTKPSTKKRKAAGSVRGSNVVTNTNYSSSAAPSLPTTHQQQQQQQQQLPSPTNQSSHCLKQSPTMITPNKTLNSPYMVNSNNNMNNNINDDMMLQNNHFPRSTGNHPPSRPMHQIPPGGGGAGVGGGGGRPPFQPNDSCVMHYSDMMCGQNTGSIPIEQSNNNMDMMTMVNSRHSGTPKSGESFPGVGGGGGGPISPTSGAPLGSRTVASNCSGNNYGPGGAGGGGNYGISGNMSNKPTNHAYFSSPDTMMMMMGPNSDSMGMRSQAAAAASASAGPNTPCTQHLTSASLASLARLSQMSGPEGPYIPSSTSSLYTSTIGSGVGSGGPQSISGHNNTHLNRSGSFHNNNTDGNPVGLPPQGGTTPHHPHHVMPQNTRQHNSLTSPGHCGVSKSHLCNPNQPSLPSNNNNSMAMNNFNLPHSLSNQTLPVHSKFNGQGYPPHMNHPQLQPTLQHQQHQQALTGSSLPSPVPNMPVPQPQPPPPPPQQHQQPPSIQVNNTFFNAQLNVQQMNYQHVSAPGSTGQMQIHFAQQQQQPPHDHMRSVRQTDSSTIRMTNPPPQQQHQPQAPPPQSNEYISMSSNNPQMLYNNSDPMNHRIDCSKSELPLLPPPAPAPHAPPSSSSVITSSMCTPMGTGGVGGSSVAGYGNASIQITPRTPHTIQYLPTVAPQAGNQGPPGSGGGVGGGGMSSSGPNQALPRPSLRGSGGGAASGGGGGGYQYIPSDPDSNSSHHSSFQSNQSYAANQNISSQPGQFYPPSAPPNQHYPPMPQSAAAVVAGQQSYASNFQAQNNNKNAQVFPGRPMNNNTNNNSTFTWNDSSFDSMSSASAAASLGASMIVSSTGGVGDTASLNSFQASSNMQNQVMDNRLVRNIHHQQGGGSFRDPQMNSYTSSSSCNNDVTTMQSIDPIISDNLSSSSSSNHQMFTSSQPDGSIQHQQHQQQQQQRINAGQQQHQPQQPSSASQYLRQPMGSSSSSSSGKPSAASNQMHHQQQTNYQNYYQQHQQHHHHHQQQQQHHQMMMSSSSASMCGDYSAGSGDWSSTNQVQFVMSNSASSSSTMSSNTSNTSTMYNNCSSSTTINNNGSNMHNNNIVDNIPSNLTDNTNNLRSSVSNPTINNMENNGNNNMGHHPTTGKRLSVPNVPMTNNELDIKNPMHQYNSPHSSHVFPSQQQQQQMMTSSSTVSGGPPPGNRLMMNWHHHPSATGGGGNPMNFPATMSSVSSPNTNTNNPREMYSGQMMNSSKLFPPMMGTDPSGMTTLGGGGGMSDNNASNNNNNNSSGNRNMNMLRQSQENCYENNQLANIASSTSSSSSSSASTAQAYSSSVV